MRPFVSRPRDEVIRKHRDVLLYVDGHIVGQIREQFVNMAIVTETTKARLKPTMLGRALNRTIDKAPTCIACSASDFCECRLCTLLRTLHLDRSVNNPYARCNGKRN